MNNKYKFLDQDHLHFTTCTPVFWIDSFIRNEYSNILIESLKYCQQNKEGAKYLRILYYVEPRTFNYR
jgi:putative transposase